MGHGTTVLVCDDEEPLRRLVRIALESDGLTVLEACDGDEAVERIHDSRPDLVVLDQMMPGRTGLEVLAELRCDPAVADTPVIMLTAKAQASDRSIALERGADRYLPKPFNIFELTATARALLGDGGTA